MRKRRLQSGGVLIIVIAVLGAVIAIMAGAAASQRVALQATLNRVEGRRARLSAEAAIQYALATLQTQEANRVAQDDDWYSLGNQGQDSFEMTEGTFRMQIVDASSMVNLNTASPEQLALLPLTTEQIDALIDWRSLNPIEARPEGAKDEYYNTLSTPYNAKLKRLDSFDELLLIKGFDAQTLFQPEDEGSDSFGSTAGENATLYGLATVDSFSSNLGANGQAKTDINTATAQQLIQNGIPFPLANAIVVTRTATRFATMGDVLKVPGVTIENAAALIDNYAVSTEPRLEGKININTAAETTFTTIPNLTQDIASAIVSRQSAGFDSISELTSIPGFTLTLLQETVDTFTTGSQTFIIRVIGTSGRTSVPLEAVVSIQNGAKTVKIYEPPYNDMTYYWSWDAEPNNQIDLGDAR